MDYGGFPFRSSDGDLRRYRWDSLQEVLYVERRAPSDLYWKEARVTPLHELHLLGRDARTVAVGAGVPEAEIRRHALQGTAPGWKWVARTLVNGTQMLFRYERESARLVTRTLRDMGGGITAWVGPHYHTEWPWLTAEDLAAVRAELEMP